jgi:lysophospholipase L1-like esterase
MTFISMRKALHGLAAALVVVTLAALASCGGGGEVEDFKPTRILAFGDEQSVITPSGRKYTVNAFGQKTENGVLVDDPTVIDCTRNPLWIQSVATAFSLAFDRCLGTATAASGQILAQPGHKVADFAAQIAAVQGASLNELDLALVMLGTNDLLELYAQYLQAPTTRSALIDQARARGAALGNQVNALANSGPAVVVLTVPDLSLSPFARAADTAAGDTSRSAMLRDLTLAFNNRMSVTLINDGRLIGLVYGDIESQNIHAFRLGGVIVNVDNAACATALPDCTPGTLVTGATAAGHMWADDLRPGPSVQGRLGALAASRATSNPF